MVHNDKPNDRSSTFSGVWVLIISQLPVGDPQQFCTQSVNAARIELNVRTILWIDPDAKRIFGRLAERVACLKRRRDESE
jgi:hypothetical protein